MTLEGNVHVPPPPPNGGCQRRRHRRGQGRQQLSAEPKTDGSSVSILNLSPENSMLCREANEANLALLRTLPQHLADGANLSGIVKSVFQVDVQLAQNEAVAREFKTLPCTVETSMPSRAAASHDHRCCAFYHSERDRRRLVYAEGSTTPLYSAEPCEQHFDDQRQCSNGDNCRHCHSTAELLYHPDFFRKRLCHQAKRCPRGRFCAFAHSRQELLVPHFTEREEKQPSEDFIAWRFKTQWCPIGGPHDWENCVYAHTYRDWRRVPTLGYCSRPCPHWVQSINAGPAELLYADRCPAGMGCRLAHGAKEQLYHPQFYKTSPCSEGDCKRGTLCAFTHGPHDTRKPKVDEPLPDSMRLPILQAVELLGRSQPTFWSPPRYDALEQPPRQSASSKNRNRSGSKSLQDWSSAWNDNTMDSFLGNNAMTMLPPTLPSIAGDVFDCSTGMDQASGSQFQLPYLVAQQYGACSADGASMMPMSGGYGQSMYTSWTMPLGYSPWQCGGFIQQPVQPSEFLMTSPMAQSLEQANHIDDIMGEEQSDKQLDISPQSISGPMDVPDFGQLLHGALLDNMPSRLSDDANKEEHIAPSSYHLRRGLRTPSSFGSPPLSIAPTEAPSPRLQAQEVDSNSSNHERDSSSNSNDGTAIGSQSMETTQHIFDMSKLRELRDSQMLLNTWTTDWAGPQVPTLHDLEQPLAIQNFMEAPCPASPSR